MKSNRTLEVRGRALQASQVLERRHASGDAVADVHLRRVRVEGGELRRELQAIESAVRRVVGHAVVGRGGRGIELRPELLERERQTGKVLRVVREHDVDVIGLDRAAAHGGSQPSDQHERHPVRPKAGQDAQRFEPLNEHACSSPRPTIGRRGRNPEVRSGNTPQVNLGSIDAMTRTVASIVGGMSAERRSGRPPQRARTHRISRRPWPRPCWATPRRSSTPAAPRAPPSRGGRPSPPRSAAGPSNSSGGWSRTTRRRCRSCSRARSASRSRSRGARCRRSSTPATSSWARAAGSTARPCRRRCRTSSSSRSARRSGVAAIVTAGNFPVAVPSWYLVPALLCGNAVVWKPAEYTPATAEAFAQLFLHAGLPDGVVQHGARRRCGDVRGARAGARRASDRQGRVHRLHRRRPADRRALRAAPPDRRASSWAGRTRSS